MCNIHDGVMAGMAHPLHCTKDFMLRPRSRLCWRRLPHVHRPDATGQRAQTQLWAAVAAPGDKTTKLHWHLNRRREAAPRRWECVRGGGRAGGVIRGDDRTDVLGQPLRRSAWVQKVAYGRNAQGAIVMV